MFFIEVFERVHRDREAEYLQLSRDNDIIVKQNEPGMPDGAPQRAANSAGVTCWTFVVGVSIRWA